MGGVGGKLKMEVAPACRHHPPPTTHHPLTTNRPHHPQVAPVVKETKRRCRCRWSQEVRLGTLHKLESTIEIVEDVVEEVVEGQGFRALDAGCSAAGWSPSLRSRPSARRAPPGQGRVGGRARRRAPDPRARRHLQDDEEERRPPTRRPTTSGRRSEEAVGRRRGALSPRRCPLLDTSFDTDARRAGGSVTLLPHAPPSPRSSPG